MEFNFVLIFLCLVCSSVLSLLTKSSILFSSGLCKYFNKYFALFVIP